MRSIKNKWIIIPIAAGLVAVGTYASADSVLQGVSGNSSATSNVPVTAVISGGSDTELYPGDTNINDTITVSNPGSHPEDITAVTAGSSSAFTAVKPSPVGKWTAGTVPAGTVTSAAWKGDVSIPSHGSVHVTIMVSM